jgi:hypothetical protein
MIISSIRLLDAKMLHRHSWLSKTLKKLIKYFFLVGMALNPAYTGLTSYSFMPGYQALIRLFLSILRSFILSPDHILYSFFTILGKVPATLTAIPGLRELTLAHNQLSGANFSS